MNPGEIVVSGGLWLAVPIALAAGLLSFLSPCVLPLVPGYFGYLSSAVASDGSIGTAAEGTVAQRRRHPVARFHEIARAGALETEDRLLQVADQVAGVLQADIQPHQFAGVLPAGGRPRAGRAHRIDVVRHRKAVRPAP